MMLMAFVSVIVGKLPPVVNCHVCRDVNVYSLFLGVTVAVG